MYLDGCIPGRGFRKRQTGIRIPSGKRRPHNCPLEGTLHRRVADREHGIVPPRCGHVVEVLGGFHHGIHIPFGLLRRPRIIAYRGRLAAGGRFPCIRRHVATTLHEHYILIDRAVPRQDSLIIGFSRGSGWM